MLTCVYTRPRTPLGGLDTGQPISCNHLEQRCPLQGLQAPSLSGVPVSASPAQRCIIPGMRSLHQCPGECRHRRAAPRLPAPQAAPCLLQPAAPAALGPKEGLEPNHCLEGPGGARGVGKVGGEGCSALWQCPPTGPAHCPQHSLPCLPFPWTPGPGAPLCPLPTWQKWPHFVLRLRRVFVLPAPRSLQSHFLSLALIQPAKLVQEQFARRLYYNLAFDLLQWTVCSGGSPGAGPPGWG